MRYIGNKDSITHEIYNLLQEKKLIDQNLTFFDAFCGTGAVAAEMADTFNIKLNDSLKWCTIYSNGRIKAQDVKFKNLGFNPIDYFNSNKNIIDGFFKRNYSPYLSERMYFSEYNAGRIDYFRKQIEEWLESKKINLDEYHFLLSCLIESLSRVANTAGVYGAFLKKWDPRALKPIVFLAPPVKESLFSNKNIEIYNDNIENIISEVECDILYMDPPYTQNQYGTQYHLLETLILNDNPSISKITGSRPTGPMRSDWSKNYKAHIAFDNIVSKTKAKYILFSYSPDGFMSRSFIEASLKRYGKKETYLCKKISYKKYNNFKSRNTKDHHEYLFFIEKKEKDLVTYESPLNYIGSKSKMILNIKNHLPNDINTFYDLFGGGFNVGININCETIIYNEINPYVADLIRSFKEEDTYKYILFVKKMISKYNLEPKASEPYKNIRDFYNSKPTNKKDSKLLFTVLLYGYNQQIRFNSKYEFNNPVGMRWFNDKVLEKMISFSRVIKEKNIEIYSKNYNYFEKKIIKEKSFVYLDPPYRNTIGSYNDGKRGFEGWSKSHEEDMTKFANQLTEESIKFMISYVRSHRGKINEQIISWIEKEQLHLIAADEVPGRNRKEVFIKNYE